MAMAVVVPPAKAIRVRSTSKGYVLKIVTAPAAQPASSFSPYIFTQKSQYLKHQRPILVQVHFAA